MVRLDANQLAILFMGVIDCKVSDTHATLEEQPEVAERSGGGAWDAANGPVPKIR